MAGSGMLTEADYHRLISENHKALLGYFLAAGCRRDDAEELAQDVWVALLKDVRQDKGEGFDATRSASFHTYVKKRYAVFRKREYFKDRARAWADAQKAATDPQLAPENMPGATELAEQTERYRVQLLAYRAVFRVFFLYGGYPHQQLACAWSKHIYGRQSPRGIDGLPAQVDAKHGLTPLDPLALDYWNAYRRAASIRDKNVLAELRGYLDPMLQKMTLPVNDLFKINSPSEQVFGGPGNRQVGVTWLRQYYEEHKGGFADAIPDWCNKVKHRINKYFGLDKSVELREAEEHVARDMIDNSAGNSNLTRK